MAGIFKKAMEALGLDDGDGYDDDYEAPAPPLRRRVETREPTRDPRERVDPRDTRGTSDEGGTIVHPRGDPRYSSQPAPDAGVVGVSPQRGQASASGTVRTMGVPRQHSFHLASPTEFADVKDVGERFRSNQPVIINLTGAGSAEAKRILDFASGLIFGLNGEIKKVADRVFMLTPAGYEVSADQKRELQQKGLHP
jgi:cell division inhibitor SepF